jgi:uncharacterized protein with NAD-binding domain and iron-sulfur cluster
VSNAPTFATDPERTIRVAIVGGGCAALTTAFELTRPEHRGRYEVTLYQMGWRLGGKGASGRGVAGRIEEHGLHLWLGYYENAFRLIRECYDERRAMLPDCRFADWRDAFTPAPDVGVTDRTGEGWEVWLAHFPPSSGTPGDPITDSDPFTMSAYLRQTVRLVGELLRSAYATRTGGGTPAAAPAAAGLGPDAVITAADALLRYGRLATTAAVFEATDILRQTVEQFFPHLFLNGAATPLRLIDAIAAESRRQLERLVEDDGELRRVWCVIDLTLAILRGATVHRLALDPRGFDAINKYDFREWVRMHGASEQTLDSGFVRGLYDLAFAYEGGDVERPRLAAGAALRGTMRMFFTYRGALFWRMNAGMGDVVFAPLYQVLRQRGVRFEFFHRLADVKLAPPVPGEPSSVESLEFDVQALVKGGGEYQPLVEVHGVPSWPAAPDFSQLVKGKTLQREGRSFEAIYENRNAGSKTIRVTTDFDFVVLGIPVAAIPHAAADLLAREPRWRQMVRHLKTVPTQSFQVWLEPDMHELGWERPPVNLSGFVEPFDTWADMSHLTAEEQWPGPVRSVGYFCSVLSDTAPEDGVTREFHEGELERVRANAVSFLNEHVQALWPRAVGPAGGFRWEALATANGAQPVGEERFDCQHWAANVNPTDRYVLSVPGSIEYRLSPLDMTFDNLTIAGDWTASGLDLGCIESAVMSGMLAANALSNKPRLEDIVGYDHP